MTPSSAPAPSPPSPLAEIERAVQERAKDISLEMGAPGGEAKLRALIVDEVARWNDDHRRGRRAFALPDAEPVVERAFRYLAAIVGRARVRRSPASNETVSRRSG